MLDKTYRRPLEWKSAALSDVGCVRPVNEDSVFESEESKLWVVADGMGGHEIGDVASRSITENMQYVVPQEALSDYVDLVEDTILHVNQQLLDYSNAELNGKTMGSTVVAMFIKGDVGVCLWAGDSRIYRLRQHRLQQLSRDHSQVEEMVRLGMITPEEMENHPDKNVITRAVGVESHLYIDLDVFNVQVGDTFLLCSDGLYNSVSEAKICEMLSGREPLSCAQTLIDEALANGVDDNVSVVVVKGQHGTV